MLCCAQMVHGRLKSCVGGLVTCLSTVRLPCYCTQYPLWMLPGAMAQSTPICPLVVNTCQRAVCHAQCTFEAWVRHAGQLGGVESCLLWTGAQQSIACAPGRSSTGPWWRGMAACCPRRCSARTAGGTARAQQLAGAHALLLCAAAAAAAGAEWLQWRTAQSITGILLVWRLSWLARLSRITWFPRCCPWEWLSTWCHGSGSPSCKQL